MTNKKSNDSSNDETFLQTRKARWKRFALIIITINKIWVQYIAGRKLWAKYTYKIDILICILYIHIYVCIHFIYIYIVNIILNKYNFNIHLFVLYITSLSKNLWNLLHDQYHAIDNDHAIDFKQKLQCNCAL